MVCSMAKNPHDFRGGNSWQTARVVSPANPFPGTGSARDVSSSSGPSYASPYGSPWQGEMEQLRAQLREQGEFLEKLQTEPRLCATVVEVREDSMLTCSTAGLLDVELLEGAKVGDRVMCVRQTMQALEVVHDEAPTGTIITVERVTGHIVEANLIGQPKTFVIPRGPDGERAKIKAGERVVLDASLNFVIGSLGMPPAKHALPPKIGVTWDDIGGHAEAKDALREAIELPITHAALFKAYGKQPVKGVLLEGPAGCGKTALAKAAATSIAKAHGQTATEGFIYVKGPELLNKFVGQSEENIRNLFIAAKTHRVKHGYAAVVFIDEGDALLGKRDRSANFSMNATVVPQFLAEMDGLDDFSAMFIIATNRADMLDPAVTRDGRIDRKVRVGRPSREDARAIFEIHLRGRPLAGTDGDAPKRKRRSDASSAELIERVIANLYSDHRVIRDAGGGLVLRLRDFVSGAMIARGVVEQASTAAIRRDIAGGVKEPSGITEEDLIWAIDRSEQAVRNTDHDEVLRELVDSARTIAATSASPA